MGDGVVGVSRNCQELTPWGRAAIGRGFENLLRANGTGVGTTGENYTCECQSTNQ